MKPVDQIRTKTAGTAKRSKTGGTSARDERQYHMRRTTCVHENRVASDPPAEPGALGRAGIRVDIEMREVAGRDIDPDAVAAFEQVCGGKGFDLDPVHLAGRHQGGTF